MIWLAEALAARGHRVICLTRCQEPVSHNGVDWIPLQTPAAMAVCKTPVDLLIANRGHRALTCATRWRGAVGTLALWVHNPARYLLKRRYLWPIWRHQPTLIFLSEAHVRTYPRWAPGRRSIIPHGISPLFFPAPVQAPPPPRAVFLSNPLRGLGRLIDLWTQQILPHIPQAELHLFTGRRIMATGEANRPETSHLLQKAADTPGLFLHDVLPREELAPALRSMRVFCYPADQEESFCLSAAEAQASGLPGVVTALGALPERIQHGRTGFVVAPDDPEGFARALRTLLADDQVWSACHTAARSTPARSWTDAAADILRL